MTIDSAFHDAVLAARTPRELSAGGVTRLMYDVSGIPGAARLPRALLVLLENVMRRATTTEDAVREAFSVILCRPCRGAGCGDRVHARARALPGLHGRAGLRGLRRHA